MIEPFYSTELHGRTMSRFGVVLNADCNQASQEVSKWVMQEAVRAGWGLSRSDSMDEGLVWIGPKVEKRS